MTKCICTLFMYELIVQGKCSSLFASIKHSILIKMKFELLRPQSGEALQKQVLRKTYDVLQKHNHSDKW